MKPSIASPYCMGHPLKINFLVRNDLSDLLEYGYCLPACQLLPTSDNSKVTNACLTQ